MGNEFDKIQQEFEILFDAVLDGMESFLNKFGYFVKINANYFSIMFKYSCPFVMLWLGQYAALERGKFAVGGEILLAIVFLVFENYFKGYARKNNTGDALPMARKRFTVEDGNGEISIDRKDLEEMIIYVNEIENYIEREGLRK